MKNMNVIPKRVTVTEGPKISLSIGAIAGALVYVPWWLSLGYTTWPMIIVSLVVMLVIDGIILLARG